MYAVTVAMQLQFGKPIKWSIDSSDGSIAYNIDRILRPWESFRVFDWGDCYK